MEDFWQRIGECLRHGYHPALDDLRAAYAQVWPEYNLTRGVRCTRCAADGCGACQHTGFEVLPAWMRGETDGRGLD